MKVGEGENNSYLFRTSYKCESQSGFFSVLIGRGNLIKKRLIPTYVRRRVTRVKAEHFFCVDWKGQFDQEEIESDFGITSYKSKSQIFSFLSFSLVDCEGEMMEEEGTAVGGRSEMLHWSFADHSALKGHPAGGLKLADVVAERDAALRERNAALAERRAADAERDAALLQRDVACNERNRALMERDAAVAALERLWANPPRRPPLPAPNEAESTAAAAKLLQMMDMAISYPLMDVSSSTALQVPPLNQTQMLDTNSTQNNPNLNPNPNPNPNPPAPKKRNRCSQSNQDPNNPAPKISKKKRAATTTIATTLLSSSSQELVLKAGSEQEANNLNGDLSSTFDVTKIPIPVCSCTGTSQQCYRWGSNGGWQSACCTNYVSTYPLPMNPAKRGSRVPGRKMSGGAFKKLLARLAAEDPDAITKPVDLKLHWAKHGTNRYITVK